MRKGSASFTLIEVMLAVAIFAFAAVGFTVALNDVLGINAEMMRTSQRRQMVESLAARILAASNNLQEQGARPSEAKFKTWELKCSFQRTKPIFLAASNPAANRPVQGWFLVGVRAEGKNSEALDGVSFLVWPQR